MFMHLHVSSLGWGRRRRKRRENKNFDVLVEKKEKVKARHDVIPSWWRRTGYLERSETQLRFLQSTTFSSLSQASNHVREGQHEMLI